jgi:hypothetical protein
MPFYIILKLAKVSIGHHQVLMKGGGIDVEGWNEILAMNVTI